MFFSIVIVKIIVAKKTALFLTKTLLNKSAFSFWSNLYSCQQTLPLESTFCFQKVRSRRSPTLPEKRILLMSFFNCLFFEVTFFIVKKSLLFRANTVLIIYCSPVWNRALLFQNSGFPTCINFLVFIVKKPLLFLTNTIHVIDFPFRKSPTFREIRLFLCVSTELFWVVRSFKKK